MSESTSRGAAAKAHAEADVAGAAFHTRIDTALGDGKLRQALSMTTGRLATGRATAFAALPYAEALRVAAQRIRAHTIAHLDRYLVEFTTNAERAGCRIHWAETAADAARMVVEIARASGVSLAVKSKSMLSEEIELNSALESAGIRVVETDLGEFVVQLAGDRPSHIIAPIVHRRREDVAALFREKLGATDEEVATIPAMTAFARKTLRDQFVGAGMGVSGVNLAVADTGSLCLVTNEGNGRLTTTLPRVHVALLGLERLVPTSADLSVVLQLLARSATGQAMPVYTNVLTGPRRRGSAADAGGGEPDGPDQLHIVIVDNGRTRLLGSELAEILYCVRCGACLNVCPVYRQIGGHAYGGVYPGPVGSVVMPGLEGLGAWSELPQASSLCGACRDVCPVRIDLPRLLLKLRAQAVRQSLGPAWLRLGMRIFAAVATRPAVYRHVGNLVGRIGAAVAPDGWLTRLPGPLAAWTQSRDFPAPAAKSFTQSWRPKRGAERTRR
ncbi:MAG: LutB/LldF family L-lactate oxidation iron-sulfur protein [Acidobacteria bacterium]|nr:LutB/LldF family L-lactate oxidation iron-sulfur protein [Acidobacteriota bacterium]